MTNLNIEPKITINQALMWAAEQIARVAKESARREARLLMEFGSNLDATDIVVNGEKFLSKEQMSVFSSLIKRRKNCEPIAKIIGKKEFWSIPFYVDGNTLDPRPDSEALIEAVLGSLPSREAKFSILDLGTGSGCLLLTLLSELPNAKGVGVDTNHAAIEIAKKNAQQMNLQDRVEFINSDWTENVNDHFDIIISNPPYIKSGEIQNLGEELSFDPLSALDGGEDGLDCYRKISKDISRVLRKGGTIFLEIGYDQENDVCQIFQAQGFKVWGRRADLAGHTRCLMLGE